MKKNETVVISGASSGIGQATALIFAKNGFDLILLGRNVENLQKTEALCFKENSQSNLQTYACDIYDVNANDLQSKSNQTSKITALVNNAGIYHQQPFESTQIETWIRLFQTNLLGSIKLTQLLWPEFIKNKCGSIINVSSTLGLKPIANTSAYSALKSAMINWTESLAIEGGRHNIRANCICPGIIDTPIHSFHSFSDHEKTVKVEKNLLNIQLLKNLGKPQDVAEAIYFLATEASRFTTGSILNVDGGINLK